MDEHIEVYTITLIEHARVSLYLCVILIQWFLCYFEGLKLKENGDTNNYISLFYKRRQKIMF